ncbi:MAG: c-type cytochrome [Cytophagaceae bacterium]|nr:c-type cytochrome [Cytophagaceae bacterium]MDW8456136.1 cbb3-type cytochrome c oxidase N-terminal domain-containing protein [Cytophagaceae bacterium]
MRKYIAPSMLIVWLSGSIPAKAAVENASAPSGMSTMEMIIIFVLCISIIVLLVILFMSVSLYNFISKVREEKGETAPSLPLFDFTQAVPVEREHEILFEHEYDGIKELNNKMPPWWLYMFYGTLIWGALYMWYYHVYSSGNIQEEEYIAEMTMAEKEMKRIAANINEENVSLLTDKQRLENGRLTYEKNCASCHGKSGEGSVGPNLTDDYWLHGGDVKSIFKSIKYGIPAKGMIPWQTQLSPVQIQEVASYIKSIRGTNPPNAKAPQGELVSEQ